MKSKTAKLIGFISIVTFLYSCSSEDSPLVVQEEPLRITLNTPMNNSGDIGSNSSFSWSVQGKNDGVEITYDLYLGLNPDNLEIVEQNIGESSIDYAKILTNKNEYYWKVRATDSNNRVAESTIFSFTTIENSGTFIDSRDNEEYRWIGIGDQIWMAENLRYKMNENALALNNDESTVSLYGRFYLAEDSLLSCPEGWHLPTNEEFDQLIEFVAIEGEFGFADYEALLKSVDGWLENSGGNNYSGYNHLPTGVWKIRDQFFGTGDEGYQWTSTLGDEGRRSIFGTVKEANAFTSWKIFL